MFSVVIKWTGLLSWVLSEQRKCQSTLFKSQPFRAQIECQIRLPACVHLLQMKTRDFSSWWVDEDRIVLQIALLSVQLFEWLLGKMGGDWNSVDRKKNYALFQFFFLHISFYFSIFKPCLVALMLVPQYNLVLLFEGLW